MQCRTTEDTEDLLELGDTSSVEGHVRLYLLCHSDLMVPEASLTSTVDLSQDHMHDSGAAATDTDGVKLNRYGVPISQGLLGRPRAQRRASVGGKWSADEDAQLKEIVQQHGAKSWKKVRNRQ